MAQKQQIQVRRGTASAWTTANPILAAGEAGYESDTGKIKYGDGTTAWAALAYNFTSTVYTPTDATTTAKGIVQLAGDLSGTAASPTVPGLATKEPTVTAGTTAQYYRGDKTFQTLNQDVVPDGTTNKAFTATEKTKLAGITGTNTGDQTITLTGDVTGTGTSSFATTLAYVGTAGTYTYPSTITTDVKGRITAAASSTTTGTGNNVLATSPTITDPVLNATTIVTDTTTGLKIGTATTQKLGFFNATPVVQQASGTDIGIAMANLGLRAGSGNYSINTSGGITSSGKLTYTATVQSGITTLTGATTLGITTSSEYQLCNATTAAFTVSLPATTTAGVRFTIKKIDSSANVVTVSGTIDGAANYTLSTQYKYVTLISTTTSGVWYVVGNN